MQRKRPAGQKKNRAPGKKIPSSVPKKTPAGELIARFLRQETKPLPAKYPSVLENLRQYQAWQERLHRIKNRRKRPRFPAINLEEDAQLVNARPKLFGRGVAATRQNLRWDARSAVQPPKEAADKSRGRKRLRE